MDPSSLAPIGSWLEQAALISAAQVQVALQDQSFCGSRIGEILAMRGWIKQETADFFAEQWPLILDDPSGILIGTCMQQAFLVTSEQVDRAVVDQHSNGLRIGAIFVLNGWVKQPTVDFFLKVLAPQRVTESPFLVKPRTTTRPGPIHEIQFRERHTLAPRVVGKTAGSGSKTTSTDEDLVLVAEEDDFAWLG